jgi:Tfp pilus assembly protein PilV
MARRSKRRLARGVTFIESLVGTLIVAVGIMGLFAMATFVYTLTAKTDGNGIAYLLAKRRCEEVHTLGSYNVPEGTTNYYYDANGANQTTTASSTSRYRVTTTVTSNETAIDASGHVVPALSALRTVDVAVYRQTDGVQLVHTGTYLSRGGL